MLNDAEIKLSNNFDVVLTIQLGDVVTMASSSLDLTMAPRPIIVKDI